MTHGHHGHNRKHSRNQSKRESFLRRYGMTNSLWAIFKKEHTKSEVHEIRQRAFSLLNNTT